MTTNIRKQNIHNVKSTLVNSQQTKYTFLAKRDYVTFDYMLRQIRPSVVCDVRAPYSGGLTFWGYFCTIL